MERQASRDGLPGASRYISSPVIAFMLTRVRTGHHYVPAVLADTGLDRPRNRNAPQPGIRAQFDLAQCPKSLYWKVNYFFFLVFRMLPSTLRGGALYSH